MAISVANFVREVSSTGGTGTYSLGGASGRYQTFVDAVGTGSKVYYHAFDDQDFESGIGTITDGSPDTLSRDTILESSNSDAAVNWPSSGQRTVVMTAPAQKTVLEDENGDVTTSRDVTAGRDVLASSGSLKATKAASTTSGLVIAPASGGTDYRLIESTNGVLTIRDHTAGVDIAEYTSSSGDWNLKPQGSGELLVNGSKVTGRERTKVNKTSSQSIPNGSFTTVEWDSEDYDVGDMWAASPGTKIIAPKAGIFVLTAMIHWSTIAASVRVAIEKNGTSYVAADYRELNDASPFMMVHSIPISVSANDEFTVEVYQASGGALDLLNESYFAARYIE